MQSLSGNRNFSPCFSMKTDSSFTQPTLTVASPPSIPSSLPPSPLCPIHSPTVSHQKRAGLQETATKHNETKFSKTRQKPSHQSWARYYEEKSSRSRQESETHSLPLLGVPRKHQASRHNTHTEDVVQTLQALACPFNLCEPMWTCLVDSVTMYSRSPPSPLTPPVPHSLSSKGRNSVKTSTLDSFCRMSLVQFLPAFWVASTY